MAISRRSSKRSARSGGGGIGKVAKAEEQQKRRRSAGDTKWLKLEDGDEVILRGFPPNEFFKDGFTHRTPIEVKGKTYHVDKMCLDQDDDGTPCPGCKDELQRRYKFWWPVIVRDYVENEDSDKAADTVVVWSGGITVAKLLNKLAKKRDLSKRDLVVSRSGSTKDDTEYDVDWEDEEDIPYSSKDKKLLEKVPDLKRYTQIPEFDDFYKGFGDDDDDSNEEVGKRARKQNPFGSKKKKSSDDDDDDKPVTRRRSASRSSSRSASSKKKTSSPTVRKRRG